MRKGMLEYCILEIISRQESYTTDIIAKLQAANLPVVEGTLYPLLTRMKNAELLTYRWQESTSGPPRKYYCISDRGREMIAELEREWQTLKNCIEYLQQV